MNYLQKQAALQKLAQMRLAINYVARSRVMQKKANTADTMLRSSVLPIPFISGPANVGGAIAGTITDDDDLGGVLEGRKNYGKEVIPGVGGWRLAHDRKVVENLLKKDKFTPNRTLSEYLGGLTSSLGAGAVGAGVGGLLGGPAGAAVGGLGGLGVGALASIGGSLATNFTKGRDVKDLEDYYDKDSTLANYLIPGRADYNTWKNLMATDRILNQYEYDPKFREEMDKKKKK